MAAQDLHMSQPVTRRSRLCTGAIAIILLCGQTVIAFGATHSVASCKDIDSSLQNLDKSATSLTYSLVDLSTSDTELGLTDSLDLEKSDDITIESAVPLLFLTPRVTSMLRDVFESDSGDQETAAWPSILSDTRETQSESSLTPVVEDRATKPSWPDINDSTDTDGGEAVPRFQRRMYRTDI